MERVSFKDDEYLLEESLQKTRRQLIVMLDDDECLQCLRDRCICQHLLRPILAPHHQLFNSPPPAYQVPKPGTWTSKLPRLKVKTNLDWPWERATASTDMIPKGGKAFTDVTLSKEAKETAKRACRKKINRWLDAAAKTEKTVFVNVARRRRESWIDLTPIWPPTKQSPWYQTREHSEEVSAHVTKSVAAFFQKFSEMNLFRMRPQRVHATFMPLPHPVVAKRMKIPYRGLSVIGKNVTKVVTKTNCVI